MVSVEQEIRVLEDDLANTRRSKLDTEMRRRYLCLLRAEGENLEMARRRRINKNIWLLSETKYPAMAAFGGGVFLAIWMSVVFSLSLPGALTWLMVGVGLVVSPAISKSIGEQQKWRRTLAAFRLDAVLPAIP